MGLLGSGAVNPLTQSDTDAIAKLSNVEVAISRNIRGVQIEFNKQSAVTYAFSVPDNQRKQTMYINLQNSVQSQGI